MGQPTEPGLFRSSHLSYPIVTVVIAFYLLNHLVPTFADDLCRSARIFDMAEILTDVYTKYFEWTGRSFVMLLNRLAFSSGEIGLTGFNLVNSAMLGLSCLFALQTVFAPDQQGEAFRKLYNASPASRSNPPFIAAICVLITYVFLLWFTPDVFAEALLWKTGAIQYFWSCIIALYILRPVIDVFLFYRFDEVKPTNSICTSERIPRSRLSIFSYCLACFLGGCWLENTSLAVILVWSMLLLLSAPSKTLWQARIPPSLIAGFTAWCSGSLFLFAAPGNYSRADIIGDNLSFMDRLSTVVGRFIEIVDSVTLAVYLVFSVIMLLNKPADAAKRVAQSLIFICLAISSTMVMVGAPTDSFVRRVAFPSEFFLVFAVLSVFPAYLLQPTATNQFRSQSRILVLSQLILLAVLIADIANVYRNYLGIWQQSQMREEWIATARETKLPLVPFLPLYFTRESGLTRLTTLTGQINDQRYFARDITTNPDHWKNTCFARAHGLPAVILREQLTKP